MVYIYTTYVLLLLCIYIASSKYLQEKYNRDQKQQLSFWLIITAPFFRLGKCLFKVLSWKNENWTS